MMRSGNLSTPWELEVERIVLRGVCGSLSASRKHSHTRLFVLGGVEIAELE